MFICADVYMYRYLNDFHDLYSIMILKTDNKDSDYKDSDNKDSDKGL